MTVTIYDLLPQRLAQPIEWDGRFVQNAADVAHAIAKIDDEDRAREFMALARDVDPRADVLIGYLLGYADDPLDRLVMFDAQHPIYGREQLTVSELLLAGMMTATREEFVRFTVDQPAGWTWRCEDCGAQTRNDEQAGWHADHARHSLALAPFDREKGDPRDALG